MRNYHPYDQKSIIQMIDLIYQEYGDVIYLQDADSDLLDIEGNYLKTGEFWVQTTNEDSEQIIGSIAIKTATKNWLTRFYTENDLNKIAYLKRFYLLSQYRGSELSQKMHDTAIQWCHQNYIQEVHLWSDTRFTRAHAFYKKHGYEHKSIRDMTDGAMPYQEYLFVKKL
ncbi:GNAT family N-acetyltransferase [Nostoc sp. TCL26-01]|uniref:GNAT family N-acetyltransferase n=1 Tax=Nostoc sp. TCL26-01 TaxID=2576904 RepID=UPI0015BB51C8|nr:GNAT family N-acetyltransferase [Nostoc sp. TCL26-01]QLE58960.1 GNAT family N-acetyltransferase [Nostoc sp. TCL26-01]